MHSRHARDGRNDHRNTSGRSYGSRTAVGLPISRRGRRPRGAGVCGTSGARPGNSASQLIRLIIDMNLTPRWAEYLRGGGYDCIHWSQVRIANAPDEEICEYARERACVAVTNDLDFPQILAHTKNGSPSVVLLRGQPLIPEVRGSALLAALRRCKAQLEAGAILTLDWSGRPRARVLPIP